MGKYINRISAVIVAVVVTMGVVNLNNPVGATVPGTNQRVSLNYSGGQANGYSLSSILSSDGKKIAFYSSATNILSSGGGSGLFERDLAAGATIRINVSTAGNIDSASGSAKLQSVSASGRYILFSSTGTNLIDGTTISSSNMQLYLRDTVASTTTLISQSLSGAVANGITNSLGVSSDGRFVTFSSNSTNLSSGVTDGYGHLYMLDRVNSSLSVLDRKTDGTLGLGSTSWYPDGAMSCDGSMVVFNYPSNLIVGDTSSNHVDVYLLDLRGGASKLTNLTKTFNDAVMGPSISCNGDYIGFKSQGTNIDPSISVTATYNVYRPYVYDRVNGAYHLAAVSTSGTSSNTTTCGTIADAAPCVRLSDTGLAAFTANDSSFTGNSGPQIYLRDVNSGTTQLVSQNSSGIAANGSYAMAVPYISEDGRMIAYSSDATNLVSGDTNGYNDVFTSLTGY